MEIPRLSRLTAILLHLQSGRIITASELAEKFAVSTRTIYRDIKALEEAGVPICTEEGKGYSLMEGFKLPPVMFTEEEANALITAEKIIGRNKDASLAKYYSEAMLKIKAVLRYSDKSKVALLSERVAYIKNRFNTKTSNYLAAIQKAITNYTLLRITYQTLSKNEITTRDIEPQALYHTQDNWIVIAWCRLREDYREFRLDRIQRMTVLDEAFSPRDFKLLEYFYSIMKKS